MAKLKTGRHTSAIKAVRQAERRAAVNRGIKVRIHDKIKNFKKLLSAKDLENASKMLPQLSSMLDKAAKKGTLHYKNASRNKARLAYMYKKAASGK
ncbi:MAG: 30S ribosomal protein S20 [Elusimicrobia bacterium]|nr:30S ribosomal protein S20 [Elusimicrobiota bacterium]